VVAIDQGRVLRLRRLDEEATALGTQDVEADRDQLESAGV
jgi:hypothetical protein